MDAQEDFRNLCGTIDSETDWEDCEDIRGKLDGQGCGEEQASPLRTTLNCNGQWSTLVIDRQLAHEARSGGSDGEEQASPMQTTPVNNGQWSTLVMDGQMVPPLVDDNAQQDQSSSHAGQQLTLAEDWATMRCLLQVEQFQPPGQKRSRQVASTSIESCPMADVLVCSSTHHNTLDGSLALRLVLL